MPDSACAAITQGTVSSAAGHQQHGQGNDLQRQADMHGAVEAHMGTEPAAHQVGDHPENLVEQEQQRDLQGRVAQPVEMQHHQHAQGPIRQGEGPVVAGDHQVLADLRGEVVQHGYAARSERPIFSASSAVRLA